MHAACGTQEVDGVGGLGTGELSASPGPQESKRRRRLLWKGREMKWDRGAQETTLFCCSKSNLNMKDLQFLSEAPVKQKGS